jgi:hypothetical protein
MIYSPTTIWKPLTALGTTLWMANRDQQPRMGTVQLHPLGLRQLPIKLNPHVHHIHRQRDNLRTTLPSQLQLLILQHGPPSALRLSNQRLQPLTQVQDHDPSRQRLGLRHARLLIDNGTQLRPPDDRRLRHHGRILLPLLLRLRHLREPPKQPQKPGFQMGQATRRRRDQLACVVSLSQISLPLGHFIRPVLGIWPNDMDER